MSPLSITTTPAGLHDASVTLNGNVDISWTWTINTPATPVLSNVDAYFDVYVLDPGAPNGVFRQPPFAHTHFN